MDRETSLQPFEFTDDYGLLIIVTVFTWCKSLSHTTPETVRQKYEVKEFSSKTKNFFM